MARLQSNEEFARRWNEEVWEARDVEAIDDLVADEFVLHDPALPEPVRGPDGVRKVVEMILAAFPDLRVELDEVVAEGETIAIRNRCNGTHEGEYFGVEPTGREVEILVAAFQRVEAATLVEEWQLVDRLGLLAQLGVVEPPGGERQKEHGDAPQRGAIGGRTASTTAPTEDESASTNTPEEAKRIARRFPEEVATGGHIDRIDEICAAGIVEHGPIGERRGREALKEQSEYVHAAFPDVSVTVEDEVATGDTAAQRLTFRGTHRGEFVGVEPTGVEVEIPNVLFTRVEGGRIAERWLQADVLGLLHQLGVVEPPTGNDVSLER